MKTQAGGFPAIAWLTASSVAVTLPFLVAFDDTPSPLFFNEVTAVIGWGAFLFLLTSSRLLIRPNMQVMTFAAALVLLIGAALVAPWKTGAPWSMSLAPTGVLMSAVLTFLGSAAAVRRALGYEGFLAVCVALLLAGVTTSLIGLLQVFQPAFLDGWWVALSTLPGRASGNLRQPNYAAVLLLWSLIATISLHEFGRIGARAAVALCCLFVWVTVLTASRLAAGVMLLFAFWALVDQSLRPVSRRLMMLLPLIYAAVWALIGLWSTRTGNAFAGLTRLASGESMWGSRVGVLFDSLHMILTHPWAGIGLGGFNFVWTLTPNSERHSKGFDNAHNLPIHLVVELGIPLAALVLLLIGYPLLIACKRALADARGRERTPRPACAMLLLVVLSYSLVELPLWYPMFLLPTMFFMALCLEKSSVDQPPQATTEVSVSPILLGGAAMVIGGLLAMADYMRVKAIFQPASPRLFQERILKGRQSLFFGQYADYAAAVSASQPALVYDVFERAVHQLLDPPLLVAWAEALNARGEVDKARYIAQRLREFPSGVVDSTAYFSPCTRNGQEQREQVAEPFQCSPPSIELSYEAFR